MTIDGAASILGYAKIVDSILGEQVGQPMLQFYKNRLSAHTLEQFYLHISGNNRAVDFITLGTWRYLCKNSPDEYCHWIEMTFPQDPELCAFLLTELGTHTERIRYLRNSAAHGKEPHGLPEAQAMRSSVLIEQDAHELTLLEWCLRILYYAKLTDSSA